MQQTTNGRELTEAQSDLIATLDDVAEHVAWEFDESEYQGFGTCGFAHIQISGNSSLYRRLRSLAGSEHSMVEFDQREDIQVSVGGLELTVMENHDSGYRLSVRNVKDYISGPEYQRLDVRKRLHSLVLQRLRYNGYAESARIYTRMD